jgi:hypothetical protein
MAKDPFSVEKPNGPLYIFVGRQHDGAVYELGPRTEMRLEKAFPHARRLPSVLLGYDKQEDFEPLHGPLWEQVAQMLTGLTIAQISDLGGFRLYDPADELEWNPTMVTSRG